MSAFDFEVGTDATSSSLLPGKDEATAGHHYVAIFPKNGEQLPSLTIRSLTASQNTTPRVRVDKRLPVRKHVHLQMNRTMHPPTDAPPLHPHPHPQTPRSARTSPAAVRAGQLRFQSPMLISTLSLVRRRAQAKNRRPRHRRLPRRPTSREKAHNWTKVHRHQPMGGAGHRGGYPRGCNVSRCAQHVTP